MYNSIYPPFDKFYEEASALPELQLLIEMSLKFKNLEKYLRDYNKAEYQTHYKIQKEFIIREIIFTFNLEDRIYKRKIWGRDFSDFVYCQIKDLCDIHVQINYMMKKLLDGSRKLNESDTEIMMAIIYKILAKGIYLEKL